MNSIFPDILQQATVYCYSVKNEVYFKGRLFIYIYSTNILSSINDKAKSNLMQE